MAQQRKKSEAATARANWKGQLRINELTCAVALYTAASTTDRISFHTINRSTGHRVRRQLVDSETGDVVAREDQVKGYEVSKDEHIILQPEEIAAAIPESDKTLVVHAFIPCAAVDELYFDRPYFLAPADPSGADAFVLVRDGLTGRKAAALAHAVLFRRLRTVLIRAHDNGLIATTLNYDYEVRSAHEAFDGITERKVTDEMRNLAEHIINTKMGTFDPAAFDDRYEQALAALVEAKIAGTTFKPRPAPKPDKVVDLLAALKQSAGLADGASARGRTKTSKAPSKSSGKSRAKGAKTSSGRTGSGSATAGKASRQRKAG